MKMTKQGQTKITGSGASQKYSMANIPSAIAKIKALSGSARDLAILDAQKLFGSDQNILNQLNKQLKQQGLLK
jgi:hypothetical protein